MMKNRLIPIILLVAGLAFIVVPLFLSSGNIDVTIQPASVIMPAAYKVYANPDVAGGRFSLFKAVIKNTGTSEIKNLNVKFHIPGIIDEWTDVPAATNLLPGQTAVINCFPVFPQSITERNTSSKERTEIKILYGSKANPTEHDESFPFDMTSVNDIVFSSMSDEDKAYLSDYMENKDLYACMVSAEDPIIKHYAETIQQRILCGEEGAGVGGSGQITDKDIQEKVRVMEGVYNATLISHMVYSETSSGVTRFGDNTSSTEHIRLPREVVSGNTGLCIELAILHASVYKAAGLNAVIFLIPGHAYPGIKVGNQYIALESTGIGGAGLGGAMTADQAVAKGMDELKTFYEEAQKGNPAYQVLDIDQLYSQGYQDMELKPDPILAGEADKITQNWPTCLLTAVQEAAAANTAAKAVATTKREAPVRRERRSSSTSTSSGWENYSLSSMSFSYPGDWRSYSRPIAQLPAMQTAIVSPDKSTQVEVFHVQNTYSPQAAIAYIRSVVNSMGENVTYNQVSVINGITRFNGTTYSNRGTFRWAGFFRPGSNGVDGVIIGTNGSGDTGVINQIIYSIR
jgi:hypothetical protein